MKGYIPAVTRIRTWVFAATTRSTNHYTITAIEAAAGERRYFDTYKLLIHCIIFCDYFVNL